jgi:DnaJ-class molecular chaperone
MDLVETIEMNVKELLKSECPRCHGKGKERHQVSRDPKDGTEDWPCPRCRGLGKVFQLTDEQIVIVVRRVLTDLGKALIESGMV